MTSYGFGDMAESVTVQEPVDALEQIRFIVPGIAAPQGSKKAFVVKGRAVIVDANKDQLKAWRTIVEDVAETALAGRTGFQDAVFVHLDFHMPRPVSVRRLRPSVAPDLDKLIRAMFDAFTDSGLWKDDSLAVSVHAQKWYADDKPFVAVKVGLLA